MESVCKFPFSFLPFFAEGGRVSTEEWRASPFCLCGVAGTVGEKMDEAVGGTDLVNVGGFWQCACL